MMAWLLVFVGGGAGSVCRFMLARRFNYSGQEFLVFPWGTFMANLLSCLVMGMLLHRQFNHHLGESGRLLFMTGFCGGFSTFSTFVYELYMYVQRGQLKMGLAYVILSMVTGLLVMAGGYRAGGLLWAE